MGAGGAVNLDAFLTDELFHEWVRRSLDALRVREWAQRLDDEAGLEETWQMLRAKRGSRR